MSIVEAFSNRSDITFDEATQVAKRKNPTEGVITFFDDKGEMKSVPFGNITRQQALWLLTHEQLRTVGVDT